MCCYREALKTITSSKYASQNCSKPSKTFATSLGKVTQTSHPSYRERPEQKNGSTRQATALQEYAFPPIVKRPVQIHIHQCTISCLTLAKVHRQPKDRSNFKSS